MKKTVLFFLLLICFNSMFAQKEDCARNTNFGDVTICLPKVDGYKECYTHPIVKDIADASEVPTNKVLGYYLNENTYSKKEQLGQFSFDDYFKIYATKQLKDFKTGKETLQEIKGLMKNNFISKNWEAMKKELKDVNSQVEVGLPVVIKNYSLNENSFTYVLLTKYEVENEDPYTLVLTVNGILVNERLIWMAYYLNYEGESTITKLQEKSNIILNRIIDNN